MHPKYHYMLEKAIHQSGMKYHQYTDDIQQYVVIQGQAGDIMVAHTWCLEAVGDWMGQNNVRLNPNKRDMLLFIGSKF